MSSNYVAYETVSKIVSIQEALEHQMYPNESPLPLPHNLNLHFDFPQGNEYHAPFDQRENRRYWYPFTPNGLAFPNFEDIGNETIKIRQFLMTEVTIDDKPLYWIQHNIKTIPSSDSDEESNAGSDYTTRSVSEWYSDDSRSPSVLAEEQEQIQARNEEAEEERQRRREQARAVESDDGFVEGSLEHLPAE